ncbi:FAD-dependent oxidoreductase [Clostridium swellfunianum]|uniref:FAD-dependent oxidoreductase n=1 Tax=Clostridium swellfunianum TaxID=1367462 RepID=UPI0020301649|nr:FAD-dependent oxidoreductase [Clostridium swellfunianum]MCM0647600.1 FAD-dependent oxidoreductase [Clostridium swellfunianum]
MFLDYTKRLKVIDEYDIIVCGGGPAGFSAAVQAGRLGLKVALVEQYGALGGAITTGGNTEVALFFAGDKQIISGVGWELMKRLEKEGFAKIPDFKFGVPHWELGVKVNGPMAAYMMDEMCAEANVKVFLLQQIIDVIVSKEEGFKKVKGIILASKNGPEALKGKMIIDCTGDGDVCAMGGAEYELGDPFTKEVQPGTLRFYPTGYDLKDIKEVQVEEAFSYARQKGELTREDYWSGNSMVIFSHYGNNINHIEVNGVDNESKACAEVEGRKSVNRIIKWARKYVNGAENIEPVACGNEVCIRETRRIIGDKYITVEDYLKAKLFNDAVCYTYYPVDLHTKGENTLENIFLDKGKVPVIPLGALIPKGFSNVMVAGRCISGDRLANSAYRIKASCMAMGQAAAAAAVLSIKSNVQVRDIDIMKLRKILKEEGAIVPESNI